MTFKKALALILAIAMCSSMTTPFSVAESETVIRGDVTGDGKINSRDIAVIQKHILGNSILSDNSFDAADANADGSINSRDISLIQKQILGTNTAPAVSLSLSDITEIAKTASKQDMPQTLTYKDTTLSKAAYTVLFAQAISNIDLSDIQKTYTTATVKTNASYICKADFLNVSALSKSGYVFAAEEIIAEFEETQSILSSVNFTANYMGADVLFGELCYEHCAKLFADILVFYTENAVLPQSVNTGFAAITLNDVLDASHSLYLAYYAPNYVNDTTTFTANVSGVISLTENCRVSQAQFFKLMCEAIAEISDSSPSAYTLTSVKQNSGGTGDGFNHYMMCKDAYIYAAKQQLAYMATNATPANYITFAQSQGYTNQSGELHKGNHPYEYQFMGLVEALANYRSTNTLPDYVFTSAKLAINTNLSSAPAPIVKPAPEGYATLTEIGIAADSQNLYYKTNTRFLDAITIGGQRLNMPTFLALLTLAVKNINDGKLTEDILLPSAVAKPIGETDNNVAGNILKEEYLTLANEISTVLYAENAAAPNSFTTSLGTLSFTDTLEMFVRIVAYFYQNNTLPEYCEIAATPTLPDMSAYLKQTANCQVNNAVIQELAVTAKGDASTPYETAKNIFDYLQENTSYYFPVYSNTRYGALQTWQNRTGNCCDLAHMLVAVWRAGNVPARYYHAQVTSSAGSQYGHVWAQAYVNGIWYHGDLANNVNYFSSALPITIAKIREFNGTYMELPF